MAETKTTNKERLREITAGIEDGIKQLFESERYMQYLRTMSRFHKYSVNNQMLIYMQKPDATLVAGFNKWRDQFSRNVKRGEKGIKIIAPTPYKKKIEEMKRDPDTKAPVLDRDGNAIMEEKEVQIPMYRPVTVFDVAQTEGKPLPQLAANLTGNVQQYEVFMEALRRASPVPMEVKPLSPDMDGYFSTESQSIAIREGMSEAQTVCAAIHEITHAKLHNYEQERIAAAQGDETKEPTKPKDRATEEVEAESVSYAVCQYYGIETSANSFGYIATWSNGKELPELRTSLETVNKTASGLITDVDRHFREICKERGIDLAAQPEAVAPEIEQAAPVAPEAEYVYKLHANPRSVSDKDASFIQAYQRTEAGLIPGDIIGFGISRDLIALTNRFNEDKPAPEEAKAAFDAMPEPEAALEQEKLCLLDETVYLHVQASESGYDYTLYDKKSMKPLDGGLLDRPDVPISTACLLICDRHDIGAQSIRYAPLEMIETLQAAQADVYEPPLGGGKIVDVKIETYDPNAPLPDFPADYPLPDPAVTIADRDAYGYTENDMLPLSQARAAELFERDETIYMLHPGNASGMAFDMDDIDQHNGLFGIRREDWEQEREYLELTAGHELADNELENIFLNNPADAFAIYQLKRTEDMRDLRFEPLAAVAAAGLTVEHDNYELVYTGELPKDEAAQDVLDDIYIVFNENRPEDFRGHSLSMSDIVALKQDGVVSCHYVDRIGFAEIPTFLKPDNPLKNAEMAMEDDYGMIDGVINNGPKQPTVAELEQQAKNNQPISLMDLAAAAHRERDAERREKKPSVLEQLKSQPKQEHKKTAPKKSAEREL